ncbi:MAG: RdgB/HAM1 family non-canonical purine NTP pyrophosphatase [Azospirillaceae bacterium]|nr:RdgB/HAM1 family non-canonical purine NTP pyrophosphatase [Azospirillaceae bacterium]
MTRRFSGQTLVIASHNKGKVVEITALLGGFVAGIVSAADLGLAEPEETGTTFIANAELKARAAASGAQRVALADDSGLVVPALGGAPGILSARWAGPDRDFAAAMARIHAELPPEADRHAYFVCALALAWPDGHCETVEGRAYGTLVPPRGSHGFGYDPIFQPNGFPQTYGEMNPVLKNHISHRNDAFLQLVQKCFA